MAQDIPYLLSRAETEAVRAIQAGDAPAAAVHEEMCLLYTGRALGEMLADGLALLRARTEPAG